jgi:hypothetical protein
MNANTSESQKEKIDVEKVRHLIMNEVYRIIGVSESGAAGKFLDLIFRAPSRRFATICTRFETLTAEEGFQAALQWMIEPFVTEIFTHGIENIPPEGPLLLVSNHPGAYDSVAIGSKIARMDMKVIVSDIAFVKQLPATSSHMIYIADDVTTRMNVIRATIEHLKTGGGIIVFPTGLVDPEPAIVPGASLALERWSASVEIMLRKVPDTQLLITTASNVLAKGWLENPFTSLQKVYWKRQRLAELFQICQQLVLPGSLRTAPKITFGKVMTYSDLKKQSVTSSVMPVIIDHAKKQLQDHITTFDGYL